MATISYRMGASAQLTSAREGRQPKGTALRVASSSPAPSSQQRYEEEVEEEEGSDLLMAVEEAPPKKIMGEN